MSPELPEAGAPQTVLFALVKRHLTQVPFEPFRIVTASGRAADVPTADHAAPPSASGSIANANWWSRNPSVG